MFSFFKGSKPAPYRIVYNGNPALRRKSFPVTEITPAIRAMAERMIVTLKESEVPGVGLAAPQVGENVRMIVIDTRPVSKKDQKLAKSPGEQLLNPRMPMALINPEIISSSAEKSVRDEGCLSIPGVGGEVKRPARVTLRALDIDGHEIVTECGGLLARCLQHEIDHLDGILFVDRISPQERAEAEPQLASLEMEEAFLSQTKQ